MNSGFSAMPGDIPISCHCKVHQQLWTDVRWIRTSMEPLNVYVDSTCCMPLYHHTRYAGKPPKKKASWKISPQSIGKISHTQKKSLGEKSPQKKSFQSIGKISTVQKRWGLASNKGLILHVFWLSHCWAMLPFRELFSLLPLVQRAVNLTYIVICCNKM